MLEAMNAELKDLLDRQVAGLEERIEQTLASDDELARTADILLPFPGSTLSIALCSSPRCPSLANSRVSRPLRCAGRPGSDRT